MRRDERGGSVGEVVEEEFEECDGGEWYEYEDEAAGLDLPLPELVSGTWKTNGTDEEDAGDTGLECDPRLERVRIACSAAAALIACSAANLAPRCANPVCDEDELDEVDDEGVVEEVRRVRFERRPDSSKKSPSVSSASVGTGFFFLCTFLRHPAQGHSPRQIGHPLLHLCVACSNM